MKKKYLIVIANYYEDISKGLLDSALKLIPKSNIVKIITVPGVFEIPITISKKINKFDAFIALGCVIKGETPHFDFISQSVANGVKDLNILFDIPFLFCVLTDLNWEQALNRSGGKMGNKGSDSAIAAIELIKNCTY